MDASIATQVIESIEGLVQQVSDGLQAWAWAVFTVTTLASVLVGYAKEAAKGNVLAVSFFGTEVIYKSLIGVAIIGYFTLALPFMEVVRGTGMELSGSGQESVPIGEIARQASAVTEAVNETIDSFRDLGWIEQIGAIPQLLSLRILSGVVHIIYIIICLISFWVYAKFMLGYLVGGFFVGFMSLQSTEHLGQRSFSYVLVSSLPLFLLAVLQGYSTSVLNQAILPEGIVKTADLWGLIWIQVIILFLCLAAVAVPREWLFSAVGMSGAPSGSSVPRAAAVAGSAGAAIASMMSKTSSVTSSSHTKIGGGSINSGGSGGGGGSSIPKITFPQKSIGKGK